MRANLTADAVLERRNDFAAGGVVLRIGRKHQLDVEGQAHGVTLNLHVAFLHDIEQANLNFTCQVGELVNGKNAAVSAWEEPIVDGQLAGDVVTAAGCFDRVDIADHVGDGY